MTTPENFRRRQRAEAIMLILVSIFMVIQAYYFHHQDEARKKCIADNFAKLAQSYSARADLAQRDSDAKTDAITSVAQATSKEAVMEALHKYLAAQSAVNEERKDHPVPPFPPGKCDS